MLEQEIRLTYTKEGIPINHCTVNVSEVWDVDYIVVNEVDAMSANENTHRIIDGKLVRWDPVENVYWRSTPARTLDNNPFFCIREIDAD